MTPNGTAVIDAKARYIIKIAIIVSHLHSTPSLRGSRRNIAICHKMWYGKTRMAWLPDRKKTYMFIRFDRIGVHERDRQTDAT